VVMLWALRALHQTGGLEGRHVTLVISADEEEGSPAVADVVRGEATEADLCLCFEPGRLQEDGTSTFVTTRKGLGQFTVRARGKAAHAGVNPEDGASAISALARMVPELEKLGDPTRGITVNVGRFHGGTSVNSIPEDAHIEVDYRYPDADAGAALEGALLEVAAGSGTAVPGRAVVTSKVCDHVRVPPLERTDAVERMAHRIVDWGAEIGLKLAEEARGGGSDAAHASTVGCPAVCGLGAVGGGFHTDREWILRDSLLERASLAALTIERFFLL